MTRVVDPYPDDTINSLRSEVDRLRAALEDIAYPNPLHNEDDLMRIARTILEEPK